MNPTLKPEIERRITEQVKSGRFSTPEGVIEAAIAEFTASGFDENLDAEDLAAIKAARVEIYRGEGMSLADFDAAMAILGRAAMTVHSLSIAPRAAKDVAKIYTFIADDLPVNAAAWLLASGTRSSRYSSSPTAMSLPVRNRGRTDPFDPPWSTHTLSIFR